MTNSTFFVALNNYIAIPKVKNYKHIFKNLEMEYIFVSEIARNL
jgi:hypothetical protein